ncbi:MAG TPA: RsmE family RNA methyltransferase [Spirochaetia bacterium]|nr:RsmE family RNA methyltransferase [Spirochaetia bacterium]
MNLILFTEEELAAGLPLSDPRARHIEEVLRRSPGDGFDIGVIDGPRGRARISRLDGERMHLSYELGETPVAPFPVLLFVGLSRPQTMRRILRDCTSLGVRGFVFFSTDRGEVGYSESSLWSSGEVRRLLIEGAQQAFTTRLPSVERYPSLASLLQPSPPKLDLLAALDNYEAPSSLDLRLKATSRESSAVGPPPSVGLFVGSERGWSDGERSLFRSRGVALAHLGERVLRSDVACLAAVSIVLSELGYHDRKASLED